MTSEAAQECDVAAIHLIHTRLHGMTSYLNYDDVKLVRTRRERAPGVELVPLSGEVDRGSALHFVVKGNRLRTPEATHDDVIFNRRLLQNKRHDANGWSDKEVIGRGDDCGEYFVVCCRVMFQLHRAFV